MDKEQLKALNAVWDPLDTVWHSLRQLGKRASQSEKSWATLAKDNPEGFGDFAKRNKGVITTADKAVKAVAKINAIIDKTDTKLEKEDVAEIVKEIKKYDAIIDMADKEITGFLVAQRKVEKVMKEMNKNGGKGIKMTGGSDVDMSVFITQVSEYMEYKGHLNKSLQAFYRIARK